MDMATIEYGYRPSEDKVNRSFDIAILVILTAVLAIRIKGILITEKTTVLKERTVGRYKTGYCLSYRSCRVFKSDVLRIEIGSINVATRRSRSSHILTKHIFLIGKVIICQHHTILSYQRDIYFGFRNNNLLFISAFTDQDSSTHILAKIGYCIYRFLHCEEITCSVLCHYVIIMTDIFCQFRYFLCDSIYSQPGDSPCSVHIQMGIILPAFRKSRNFLRFDKHKQLLRFCGAQSLHQIMGNFVHIDKRHSHLFCHITRRIKVGTVRIVQDVYFFRQFLFTRSTTGICGNRGIFRLYKITTNNGVEQHRNPSFNTSFIDETTEIVIKGRSRISMACRISLFIIVSELDKDIISLLYLGNHFCPSAFRYETFGTAAIGGMIINTYIF